jgi:peptidoglycan hydrolase-like protein with peptidoglycan-binding domain
VQRALSQYGYGQLKQTGVVDAPTSAAIEEFERENNLPVTGKISDALLSDLATMVGHPLR